MRRQVLPQAPSAAWSVFGEIQDVLGDSKVEMKPTSNNDKLSTDFRHGDGNKV
jgi:hypothetical protein